MEEYFVPWRNAVTEFVEKRSRFITHIWQTQSEQAALACIKDMREKYWDATHNVYAYIIHQGPTRYTDDGEPQGTAGMPVLEVLRREGLENVCCVVTRYFGGTLLGAGGLVRAYTRGAADAVATAGVAIQRVWCKIDVNSPYNLLERLRREVGRCGGVLESTDYSADICLHVMVPAGEKDRFLTAVADISSGRVQGLVLGQEYRAIPREK